MRASRSVIAVMVLSLVCSGAAFCQEAEQAGTGVYNLGDIVVSATLSERMLQDVSFSASVLKADRFTAAGSASLMDILDRMTGVQVKNALAGDTTSKLTLRGFGDQAHTLILMDGLRINDSYSHSAIIDNIPLGDVERIEIIRGPNSAVHGANAVGGVVNIITSKPNRSRFRLNTDFGKFGSSSYNVSYENKLDNGFGLRVGIDRKQTDGYASQLVVKAPSSSAPPAGTPTATGALSNNDGDYRIGEVGNRSSESHNTRLDLFYQFGSGSEIGFHYRAVESEYKYKPGVSYLSNTADGSMVDNGRVILDFGGGNTAYVSSIRPKDFLRGPGERSEDRFQLYYDFPLGGKADMKLELARIEAEDAYSSSISNTAAVGAGTGQLSAREEEGINFKFRLNWSLGSSMVTGGMEWGRDELDRGVWNQAFWNSTAKSGDRTTSQNGKVATLAFFLQDEIEAGEKWLVTPGIRLDTWKVSDGRSLEWNPADPAFDAADPATYIGYNILNNRSKDALSPKLGVLFRALDQFHVRANFGQAFNPPGTYDIFGTWTSSAGSVYLSNPDLDPETNTAWDLGFDIFSKNRSFLIRTTYFRNIFTDAITNVTISTGPTTYQKQNIGKSVIQGLELDVSYKWNNHWSFFFNLTNQGSEVKSASNNALVGREMVYSPNHLFNVGIEHARQYAKNKVFKAMLNVNHKDKVHSSADNSDSHINAFSEFDAYTVWDLSLSYKFGKNGSVFLNVDNLTDERFFQYYPNAGRFITTGWKLEY